MTLWTNTNKLLLYNDECSSIYKDFQWNYNPSDKISTMYFSNVSDFIILSLYIFVNLVIPFTINYQDEDLKSVYVIILNWKRIAFLSTKTN